MRFSNPKVTWAGDKYMCENSCKYNKIKKRFTRARDKESREGSPGKMERK